MAENDIYGIDIGSYNIVVSSNNESGIKKGNGSSILENENSQHLTRCVSSFDKFQRFVGSVAVTMENRNSKNSVGTVVDLRRRAFQDLSETRLFSTNNYYTMKLLHDNTVGYTISNFPEKDKQLKLNCDAVHISYLEKVKNIIELRKENSKLPYNCVLTIPSFYTETMKNQLQQLITKVIPDEFNVLDIIPDYVATATTYGFENNTRISGDNKYICIVNVGYLSTSSTIVKYTRDKCELLSNSYNSIIGGRLIDHYLLQYLINKIKEDVEEDDLVENFDKKPRTYYSMMNSLRKAKEKLSAVGADEVAIQIEDILEDGDDYETSLSTEIINDIISNKNISEFPYYSNVNYNNDNGEMTMKNCILEIVKDSVEKAKSYTDGNDFEFDIVLSGGTIRIPIIKQTLLDYLHVSNPAKALVETMNLDDSTSIGCSYYATYLNKWWNYEIVNNIPFANEIPNNDLVLIDVNDNDYYDQLKQLENSIQHTTNNTVRRLQSQNHYEAIIYEYQREIKEIHGSDMIEQINRLTYMKDFYNYEKDESAIESQLKGELSSRLSNIKNVKNYQKESMELRMMMRVVEYSRCNIEKYTYWEKIMNTIELITKKLESLSNDEQQKDAFEEIIDDYYIEILPSMTRDEILNEDSNTMISLYNKKFPDIAFKSSNLDELIDKVNQFKNENNRLSDILKNNKDMNKIIRTIKSKENLSPQIENILNNLEGKELNRINEDTSKQIENYENKIQNHSDDITQDDVDECEEASKSINALNTDLELLLQESRPSTPNVDDKDLYGQLEEYITILKADRRVIKYSNDTYSDMDDKLYDIKIDDCASRETKLIAENLYGQELKELQKEVGDIITTYEDKMNNKDNITSDDVDKCQKEVEKVKPIVEDLKKIEDIFKQREIAVEFDKALVDLKLQRDTYILTYNKFTDMETTLNHLRTNEDSKKKEILEVLENNNIISIKEQYQKYIKDSEHKLHINRETVVKEDVEECKKKTAKLLELIKVLKQLNLVTKDHSLELLEIGGKCKEHLSEIKAFESDPERDNILSRAKLNLSSTTDYNAHQILQKAITVLDDIKEMLTKEDQLNKALKDAQEKPLTITEDIIILWKDEMSKLSEFTNTLRKIKDYGQTLDSLGYQKGDWVIIKDLNRVGIVKKCNYHEDDYTVLLFDEEPLICQLSEVFPVYFNNQLVIYHDQKKERLYTGYIRSQQREGYILVEPKNDTSGQLLKLAMHTIRPVKSHEVGEVVMWYYNNKIYEGVVIRSFRDTKSEEARFIVRPKNGNTEFKLSDEQVYQKFMRFNSGDDVYIRRTTNDTNRMEKSIRSRKTTKTVDTIKTEVTEATQKTTKTGVTITSKNEALEKQRLSTYKYNKGIFSRELMNEECEIRMFKGVRHESFNMLTFAFNLSEEVYVESSLLKNDNVKEVTNKTNIYKKCIISCPPALKTRKELSRQSRSSGINSSSSNSDSSRNGSRKMSIQSSSTSSSSSGSNPGESNLYEVKLNDETFSSIPIYSMLAVKQIKELPSELNFLDYKEGCVVKFNTKTIKPDYKKIDKIDYENIIVDASSFNCYRQCINLNKLYPYAKPTIESIIERKEKQYNYEIYNGSCEGIIYKCNNDDSYDILSKDGLFLELNVLSSDIVDID